MFWIVFGEVVVMFALFAVSWRIYQAHRPVASAGAAFPTALAPAAGSPLPSQEPPPVASRPAASPTPRSLQSFPIDLGQLNRDQAELEHGENALLMSLVHAARDYLETVVLPAVTRAERVPKATSPATTQSAAAIRKMPWYSATRADVTRASNAAF
jgi:hypothetical protein